MLKLGTTIKYISDCGDTVTGAVWAPAPEHGAWWVITGANTVKIRKQPIRAKEYPGKWVQV